MGCFNTKRNTRREHKLEFFWFPVHNLALCTEWISNCSNRGLCSLSKSVLSRVGVCEKHFTEDSFEYVGKKVLKRDAVPTIRIVDNAKHTKPNGLGLNVDDPKTLPVKVYSKIDLVPISDVTPSHRGSERSKCAVKGCQRSKNRDPLHQFFMFPVHRSDLCKQWILNCGDDSLYSKSKSALGWRDVCEEHFTDDCFEYIRKRILKKDAVPTLSWLGALNSDEVKKIEVPAKLDKRKKESSERKISRRKSNNQENIVDTVQDVNKATDDSLNNKVEGDDQDVQSLIPPEEKSSPLDLLFVDVLNLFDNVKVENKDIQSMQNKSPNLFNDVSDLFESNSDVTQSSVIVEEADTDENSKPLTCEDNICSTHLEVRTPVRTYKRTVLKRQHPANLGAAAVNEDVKPRKLIKTSSCTDRERDDLDIVCDKGNEEMRTEKHSITEDSLKTSSKEENSIITKGSVHISIPKFVKKVHMCFYCNNLYSKMKQHLVEKHFNEEELLRITANANSGSKDKELIFLTRIGDFKHNSKVLARGNGLLIGLEGSCHNIYTVGKETVGIRFTPCPDCAGFVHVNNLKSHHNSCLFKDESTTFAIDRNLFVESQAMLAYLKKQEFKLKHILLKKLKSVFGFVAKKDKLIMLFVPFLIRHMKCQDVPAIVVMMERLGFFLQMYRNTAEDENIQFHQILKPENLPLLSNTLKSFFSRINKREKIGLHKCLYSHISVSAFIWRGKCLMEGDLKPALEALQFFYGFTEMTEKELKTDYVKVTGDSYFASLTTVDIVGFKNSLNERIEQLTSSLHLLCWKGNKFEEGSIKSVWHELAEATLSFQCLTTPIEFGVIEKLKLVEYAIRPDSTEEDVTKYKNMIPSFLRFSKNNIFVCTEFLGQEYVILLSPTVKKAIDTLIKTRTKAGIPLTHPYIFSGCHKSNLSALNSFHNICIKQGGVFRDDVLDLKKRRYISYVISISEMSHHEIQLVKCYLKISNDNAPLLYLSPKDYHSELENEFIEALHTYETSNYRSW